MAGLIDTLKKTANNVFGQKKQPEKKADDPAVYSVLNLHKSKSVGDLISAHNAVQMYYSTWMSLREYYHDFMHPDTHWTWEEKAILAKKKKAAIAFSMMVSSLRTYIGAIIQNKYDIKPAPVGPTDQSLSDVYTALYHSTAFNNQVRIRDVDMISQSWIGGNSWQESFVIQTPGRQPVIQVKNQNNFAIYPDPNRRDLVTNYDCKFIDRVGWYSMDDLISIFPEKEEMIRASLTVSNSIYYQPDKAYADRQHESFDQKNGRYRVIERFYKVFKRQYFGIDTKGKRQDLGYDLNSIQQSDYKSQNPTHQLLNEPEEFLYLAVACTSVGEYLFNDEYHCQPKDAVTGKILFTLQELIDEDIGAIPSGHAEHMVGPNKVVDSMMVNTLAQAKNASGVSRIGNPDAFDEATQDDLAKNASDGDRMFWKKRQSTVQGTGIELMPQGELAADTDKGISFAQGVLRDVSSTPPALQGVKEGQASGILNDQRIQQASVQSQVQVTNYMNFLTQRAKLWMYFWNTYFTAEQVIRVVEKKDPKDPDYITINQLVMNDWGQVSRENSLAEADAYAIVFEDSFQSPTNKDKARKQLTEMMHAPAIANDPVLSAMLYSQILTVSDIPQDLKSKSTAYLEKKIADASQPKAPEKTIPSTSLALKGDLHDPETLEYLELIGAIPPGSAARLQTNPGAQVKQAGDIATIAGQHLDLENKRADLHGKELENHSKIQGIASDEADATTPQFQGNNTRSLQTA